MRIPAAIYAEYKMCMYVHVIYVKNFWRHALVQSTYARLPACTSTVFVCVFTDRKALFLVSMVSSPQVYEFVANTTEEKKM